MSFVQKNNRCALGIEQETLLELCKKFQQSPLKVILLISKKKSVIIWKFLIMDSFIIITIIIIIITVLPVDRVRRRLCPMLPSKSCSRWVCHLRQESHRQRQREWQQTIRSKGNFFWVSPGGDTSGCLPHNGELFHLGRLAWNQPWHPSPSCWWRPPLSTPHPHWIKSPRPIMVRISSIFVKG